ncbi:TPR2-like protein isoform X1 [Tanacetum coccineum]
MPKYQTTAPTTTPPPPITTPAHTTHQPKSDIDIIMCKNTAFENKTEGESRDDLCSTTLKRLKEASPLSLKITLQSVSEPRTINILLFSCGTSKEGEAHLVEWNESEGAIKREYSGFRKRSMGVV